MRQRRKRSNNTCSSTKTTPKPTKKNKKTVIICLKPVRKARTKIKKPRFLSLSNTQMPPASNYPKNVVVKDHHHQESNENMTDIFAYDNGGPTPTTLTGLLNAAVSSSSYEVARENNSTTEGSVISLLVRTALRNRERDASEEKWVSIRDVSPAATCEEEVTSGLPITAEGGGDGDGGGGDSGGLWLKLDYEEVLNAWSGKGPFCTEAETESLQTVPDLHFDDLINHGGSSSSARNNGRWSVPEDDFKGHIDHTTEIGDTYFGINGWKLGLREASVLRYKAKRQSRLFSKRIRYEVRKLNAEKRPRIKGRFVRRCVDEEK